ncbi:MAG: endonuclease/exonuclease/phosphatase family protein [Clostridiales bacterium]|jgi:endonuclease/exonuclease/phosphatase family metal-dependent hydrolase|nr:endonuclease/exonuclease/phosphatase family protein [Clostridiales bacterium]
MKRVLLSLAWLITAAVVLFTAYAGYVLLSYRRIPDNQMLGVSGSAAGTLETGAAYALVSWNVGFGAYSSDYSFFMDGGEHARALSKDAVLENTAAAARRLQALDPDFALLQEVDWDSDRSYHVDQRALFEGALPNRSSVYAVNYDSAYLFYPPSEPIGRSRAGILTLSRARIAGAVRRSLPVETGFSKFLDLDRCYSVSRIPVAGGRELCLYNLHLSAYTSDGAIATEQLRMLLSDMAAEAGRGNYALAAGDFNKDLLGDSSKVFGVSGAEFPWAQPFPEELLPGGIALIAPQGAPSCRNADMAYVPGETFVLTIDGFLASENVEVLSAEVLDEGFAHSDHNPVRLSFRLLA